MAFRTREDPDCRGMCSCGITLGVSAMAAITSSVKSRGVGRGEADALEPVDPAARAQQLAERLPVADVGAVGVDVLAEQGDLADALVDQRFDLGEGVGCRRGGGPSPCRAAAGRCRRCRCCCSPPRPRPTPRRRSLAAGGEGGGERLERVGDLDLRLVPQPGTFQQHGQLADVVGAEDDVDPGGLLDDGVPVLLGQAAADRDLHPRARGLLGGELAEVPVEPVVGVLAHGAGVEDDDVRRVDALGGADVAGALQQSRHPLGVVGRSSDTRKCVPRTSP